MEDVPPPSAANSEFATGDVVGSAYQGRAQNEGPPLLPQGVNPASNPTFPGQYQQTYDPSSNAFSGQLEMSHAQGPARQGPYNMTAMAAALPPPGYRHNYNQGQPQQRYNTAPSSNMIQHMPQIGQYAGPPNMAQLGGQPYYVTQHPQLSSYYNAQFSSPQQQHQAPQQSNMSPRHNLSYYSNQIVMNQSQHPLSAAGYYYPPTNQYQSPHSNIQNQMNPGQYILADGSSNDMRNISPPHVNDQINMVASPARGDSATDSRSNVVRGPPRKPRQSGHAIWIGNLPPQTDLMSLVQHVCKEAPGLESLFLISKSNCAFANFKDEQSCIGAQQKLHDSKFQSMVSPINDDPAAAIEFAPKAQATSNLDLPKAIPTEATDTCPRGRIIDDSARGTIFWEVERDDADSTAETEDSDETASAQEGEGGPNKAWGKPFKLEWLATTRLPFYRTRGLRNPWNSNREVKIARDGTELEPSVGRRLIGLFNRIQSPGPMMGVRPGMPIVAGYPPQPMPPPYR
ncbi:hypothetical protein ABKA04_006609 [Annulohypoxylon sp. FPYF3050]